MENPYKQTEEEAKKVKEIQRRISAMLTSGKHRDLD
jgi:hypothetical protein